MSETPGPMAGKSILVVDDTPNNLKLLSDLLAAQGAKVTTAACGKEGLEAVLASPPDLVLLDVMMPDMNGYEVCKELRKNEATRLTPVVMVTALDAKEERVKGIEAGADDFLTKPINRPELMARARSLLRIKELHDKVREQADELASFNQQLEARVEEQLGKIQRMSQLKRFLPPQIAEVVEAEDGKSILQRLQPHRRRIVVVFLDLRGFTAFAGAEEPEEVMRMLSEFHDAMGGLVWKYEGTLDRYTGDGMMIFFNDPVEVDDPEARAIHMALEMQAACGTLKEDWDRRGYELGLGIGISSGHATIGAIGFEKRFDYTAIGTVTNLSARLCGEAKEGQVLVSKRCLAATEDLFEAEEVGELTLKGIPRPVSVFNALGAKKPKAQ